MYKSLKKHGGPQVGPKKQKMGEKDHFPHAKLQNKLATTPTDQPANTATFAAPEGTFPAALFGRGGGGDFDVPFLRFVIYLRERICTALLKGFGYIALSLLSTIPYLSIRILFVILSSVCERSSYHQNEQRASHFIPSRLVSSYL